MERLLYHAVGVGDVEQVCGLLRELEDDPETVDSVLKDMIEKGQSRNGTTLLHLASSKGSIRTVKLLMSALSGDSLKRAVNRREDVKIGGYTALHLACVNGHLEIVKLLVESGADPDRKDCNCGFTSLHLAVRNEHFHIVKYLICRGGADIYARDDFGNNAAFWFKELNFVDELTEKLLGPPKSASIEEKFFAMVKDRMIHGYPIQSLPNVTSREIPKYQTMSKKKNKTKKKKKKK